MASYREFLDRGLCVIPLRKGIPQVEWSRYFYELPSQGAVDNWRGDEFALVCGKVSGVVAIDIDTDDTARIEMFAGVSPLKKIGSKGFTAFYRYNGETSQNWKQGGHVICELLSDKRLTTIPPSPHRITGRPYVWVESEDFSNLPLLAEDFVTLMDAKYPRPKTNYIPSPIIHERQVDLTETAEMLEYISSDCARDEWVQIGMALRDEFGDAACDLWHRWSAKSNKYNHHAAQACWRSFSGGGVTIGTLIYQAQQGGYLFKREEETGGFEVDLSYLFNKKPVEIEPVKIHGLVGEIADWITATAISPQPVLSLAAAISFMGLIKGHRIKNKVQGARTNMLCLSLAPTGGGKDWPQKAVDNLACAVGLEKHMMGRPTSGSAMLTGLNKASGLSLLSIEEMGRYMGNISNKNAQSFQSEITDYIIEIFSSANKIFRGKQYADEKANPQVIIKNPHLCCIASTVAEKLKAACNSSQVIDGFLNRWLVFATDTRPKKRFDVGSTIPPQSLIDKITYWMEANPLAVDMYGNMTDCKVIGFTPEAWERFLSFEEEMQAKLETEPYPINELYVRSAEHVVKLSMVICDDDFIGMQDIEAAITIVKQSNLQIAAFASGITDNQHEADVIFVLDVVKKNPHISRNQLTHKTRKLNPKLRNDILNQLIEAGNIEPTPVGKKVTFKHVSD